MKKIALIFVVLVLAKPIYNLIDNLIWLTSQPPLSSYGYTYGVFSTPGGGFLALFIILIAVFGFGALFSIWSRRQ